MSYEVTDAVRQGQRIVWHAENEDGQAVRGVFTPHVGENMVLSENGLESLREALIGKQIQESATLPDRVTSGRLESVSIGGDAINPDDKITCDECGRPVFDSWEEEKEAEGLCGDCR